MLALAMYRSISMGAGSDADSHMSLRMRGAWSEIMMVCILLLYLIVHILYLHILIHGVPMT